MAVKVVVTAVGKNSYHEYGEVLGNIELTSGRVVVENNATVSTILVTTDSKESFKVEVSSNATVGTVAATTAGVITDANTTVPSTTNKVTEAVTVNEDFAGGLGTEKSPYLVATAGQFKNIGNYSDEMKKGTSYSFELIDNIDLRTVTFEDEKISAYFCGTLDGNGNQLIASDALKYIFMDAKKVVSISAIDYQLIEKRVQLCGGMDNTWAVNLTFDDVDISTVDAATSILLGENEGLYTDWTGYSNVTGMWTSYYDNKLLIQNCDVAVNISATSYNGVFIGGGLYKTSAAIKNCTYNGSYYGELVNLVQGNGNTNASYGGTLEIENVVNLGGLYGTKRVPLFAAGTGNAEPSSVTIKDSVIGVVRYLKDDTLNISVGSDGTLVISEATAEASNYILTFTGGMRRISEYSENSSYRFSIVLSASFVDKVFNTGLKDGKMATVKQYKEFVDANATFNSSSAMSLYGEEGAKLWIVEKEGTVYYVFEFSDDYIHFENSADESAIVDINKAAITIYDNDDLPIAQAECPLK